MNLYRPIEAGPRAFRFKVYRAGEPIALSHSLPMLEHLGVRVDEERPYRIEPRRRARPRGSTTSASNSRTTPSSTSSA